MKKTSIFVISFIILLSINSFSQEIIRKKIHIPDIPGYKTLQCDFHMHTIFSDGQVWPTLRVEEAWQDGLDAIAITDHLEYRPHKEQVKGDYNAAYTIALEKSKKMGVTLIHGAEITRGMPPGHLNALFITDANKLAIDSFRLVIEEVKSQGGIVFWNHPGWVNQQPDGIAKWYDEHTWLFNSGVLKGLEIVNELQYYPEVHQWCIDKKLSMFGNSDIHIPTSMYFERTESSHRTMTLVFAKENSEAAIKEAILEGRTAVWVGTTFYGKAEHLGGIVKNAIALQNTSFTAKGKEWMETEIRNLSDITITMQLAEKIEGFSFPETITLKGNETLRFAFRSVTKDVEMDKDMQVPYKVTNMITEPGKPLLTTLDIHVNLKPKK